MKTRKFCPHCGRPLLRSLCAEYDFECNACDEDFYSFEVLTTRQIEKVKLLRRQVYQRAIDRGKCPASFKKPYPRMPIRSFRNKYLNPKRYVADPNDCSHCFDVMSDGKHTMGDGYTLEQIHQMKDYSHYVLVTNREFLLARHRYLQSLCGPFREITKDQYWYWLECVPPKRYTNNRFFLGECYTGTLYQFCFRLGDRYFTALRSITLLDQELEKQIADFSKFIKNNTSEKYEQGI